MLNKAILVGRLTADPELRQTPSGVSVTSFSIAINRPYSGKTADRQTDFIDIVAWRNTAEFICRYFRKGNAIGIDGSIQTRTYTDKNGNNRKAVEVLASNVSFVESKSASAQNGGFSAGSDFNNAPAAQEPVSYANGDFGDFSEIDADDDLPF